MPSLVPQLGHNRLYWEVLLLSFAAVALWETWRPQRRLSRPVTRRWGLHALLALLYSAASGIVFGTGAVLVAIDAADSRWGLLNNEGLPFAARCVVAILLLDLTRYAQHVLFHRLGFLWRLHQVHHSDPDYDLSTGLRFHPLEVLLTQGSYLAVVALLAPPPLAVLGVELATVFQNFFAHANAAVPGRMERVLRRWLVTPNLHCIHHSAERAEQGTNFGTLFPWWDLLFGTYRSRPAAGREAMRLGLRGMEPQRGLDLPFLLLLPFRRRARPR